MKRKVETFIIYAVLASISVGEIVCAIKGGSWFLAIVITIFCGVLAYACHKEEFMP